MPPKEVDLQDVIKGRIANGEPVFLTGNPSSETVDSIMSSVAGLAHEVGKPAHVVQVVELSDLPPKSMFADIERPTAYDWPDTACDQKEAVVRLYADGHGPRPLTAAERETLVSDADYCGEGFYNKEELEAMSDQDLARATLRAWSMYVQSNCM